MIRVYIQVNLVLTAIPNLNLEVGYANGADIFS